MSVFHDSEVCCSILESLPVGLCVVDLQKRIVFWSLGAEQITGHLRHEVIGHSCVAEGLLHCDRPDCQFCNEETALARAIKTSQPAESNSYLHHKAGHDVSVRIRAVPVHNAHGSIIGAAETFEELNASASPEHREDSLNPPGCADEMTGVASHAMMQAHLRETFGTFTEVQVPFGVLIFRLEGLDRFRANFGPEAASSLLRVVARTLEGALWRTDFVGRWSDDQFVVILNGCREEALHSVRERIRRMLAGNAIEWWGERRSLPVAIAQGTPQPGDTIDSLMERTQKSFGAASGAASGNSDRAHAASATGRTETSGSQ
jgi:diguanylate cyclase (GGDEF)-like protein/PAS domain S-box-containing protein